jgi:ABC-type amino acid transport substrate-binding protein
MRMLRFVAAGALALALSLVAARPAGADDLGTVRRRADALLDAPLPAFLVTKVIAPPPFDWRDDGCSHAPDRPFGFDFAGACARHDFGYRNFGRGLRLDPSEARRARVDERFHADLLAACGRVTGWVLRAACRHVALLYFQAVRLFGRSAFTGG